MCGSLICIFLCLKINNGMFTVSIKNIESTIYVCGYMCLYAGMYVCMYACMYVRTYMDVSISVWM